MATGAPRTGSQGDERMLQGLARPRSVLRFVQDLAGEAARWERFGFVLTPLADLGCVQMQSILFAGRGPPYGIHLVSVTGSLPAGLEALTAVPDDAAWALVLDCPSLRRVEKRLRDRPAAAAPVARLTARWGMASGATAQSDFSLLCLPDALAVPCIAWDLQWPAALCDESWAQHPNLAVNLACCLIASEKPQSEAEALRRDLGGILRDIRDDGLMLDTSRYDGLFIQILPTSVALERGIPELCHQGAARPVGVEFAFDQLASLLEVLDRNGVEYACPNEFEVVPKLVDAPGFAVRFHDPVARFRGMMQRRSRANALDLV